MPAQMRLEREQRHVSQGVSLLGSGVLVLSSSVAYAILAVITTLGQVGVNITLPLFNSALPSGAFFIPLFNSAAQALVFFVLYGILRLTTDQFTPKNTRYSHVQFFIMGFCYALNGIAVVYSSSPARTSPMLQAVLGNVTIPMTVAFRWLHLRKGISAAQFWCAAAVLVGVFISVIPTVFNMDHSSNASTVTGAARVLWPMCFALGFLPAVIMQVLQEKGLKSRSKSAAGVAHLSSEMHQGLLNAASGDLEPGYTVAGVGVDSAVLDEPVKTPEKPHLIYFLAWINFYQLVTVVLLFWTDIIHGFGDAKNLHDFFTSIRTSFECLGGAHHCSLSIAMSRAVAFVVVFALGSAGSGALCRHPDGANYVAIVQALVSPIAALWWTLFKVVPLTWHPEFTSSTWYSIGGLLFIVPGVYLYTKFTTSPSPSEVHTSGKRLTSTGYDGHIVYSAPETDPETPKPATQDVRGPSRPF